MRKKRVLIYGTNTFIFVLAVLGILVVLNYLAWSKGGRLDVTREKLYSISDQTKKVLDNLDKEVEVLAFFKEVGTDRKEFQELIGEYKRRSGKIKVRFVDPDKEPGVARKYGVTEYGTVVLVSGTQNINLRLSDLISGGIVDNAEEEITNALIKLSKDIKKTIYFLKGHGERDINNNSEPQGFGRLRQLLENEGYEVKELLLVREPDIPVKNTMLVVAGPKKPLLPKEIELIKKYLDGGGKAVFMLEPRLGGELVSFLRDYGFNIGDDIIVDPSSKLVGGGDVAPVVAQYLPHEITEGFRFATLFPYSRSVEVVNRDGIRSTVIAKTSEYSWAETNFALFDQGIAQRDPGDRVGPLGVFAVSEIGENTRIAVFGSVDLVSNRFIDFSGNSDLFLNTVNWIFGDTQLISIRPRVAREGKLAITGNQMRMLFSFTVIVVPALVLVSGLVVWWRRKNM